MCKDNPTDDGPLCHGSCVLCRVNGNINGAYKGPHWRQVQELDDSVVRHEYAIEYWSSIRGIQRRA